MEKQLVSADSPLPFEPFRNDLGEFLRKRRHQLDYATCGIDRVAKRRRTPGLRREEVAELAGISPTWYTKLEAREVQPSPATLMAIALALRLTDIETDYLFEKAGLAAPLRPLGDEVDISQALRDVVATSQGAATLYDCYFTPLIWNGVAGAAFGYDSASPRFERNLIVRGLTDERLKRFFGDDFDLVAKRTIGTFRRVLATHRPTDLAQRIYEFAAQFEIFRRYWREEAIVDAVTLPGAFVRHHDTVGEFRVHFVDLKVGVHNDAILRILTPADAESSAKFEELANLATTYLGDNP